MNDLYDIIPRIESEPAAPPAIREMIEALRQMPQREMPVTHRFQAGVYLREIFMPADTFVVGHVHKTRHHNIVTRGRAVVSMAGQPAKIVEAGALFESEAGVQKVLYIESDMLWVTVHANPDECRDVAALEERLLEIPEDLLALKGEMTVDEFRMSANQLIGGNNP